MPSDTLVYAQGQTATLTATFVTSPAGMPVDVPDPRVRITGPGGTDILAATAMTRVDTGFYFYDYEIPLTMPVDAYTVIITGTVLGTPTAMSIYLQVVEAGVSTPASASQHAAELVAALDRYIGCALRIPVYNEVARRNKNRDVFQFTWPRWNLANHIIKLNNEPIEDGYTINLDTGTVTFAAPLHPTDKVSASYNFRFFSNMDMLGFISDAIDQINIEPPQSSYTVNTFPTQFVGVMLHGAAKNAIQRLLFCLTMQEPQTIFGGPEAAKNAISTFQSLKENHEKEFAADKKTLKTKGPYPKISAIVQPEYTLPGGRSRWFRYLFSSGI